MTLCLTFDDGLKTHADIAAPALKARGWSKIGYSMALIISMHVTIGLKEEAMTI